MQLCRFNTFISNLLMTWLKNGGGLIQTFESCENLKKEGSLLWTFLPTLVLKQQHSFEHSAFSSVFSGANTFLLTIFPVVSAFYVFFTSRMQQIEFLSDKTKESGVKPHCFVFRNDVILCRHFQWLVMKLKQLRELEVSGTTGNRKETQPILSFSF